MTRYFERRAYLRVPASGDARWTCGTRSGDCQLVDISPGGAGLRFPARRAPSLGDQVRVSVPLGQGGEWRLPGDAHVVRRAPGEDGWYDIGLQFSPENWEV
jgi:c-di-GMP-binding flagellar brake protein YcgR